MTIKYDTAAQKCNFVWNVYNAMSEEWFDLTPKELDEIIADNMDDEWSTHEYDPNGMYLDTCVRERVANLVSMYYLGHPWPRYVDSVDSVDMEMFTKNLDDAIEEKRNENEN